MESQLSLHLQNFNNRIKVMNQTNAKELVLTKLEAQNLHNDVFDLLTQIAALSEIKQQVEVNSVVSVGMDGGGF
jgi:hypothetical protein